MGSCGALLIGSSKTNDGLTNNNAGFVKFSSCQFNRLVNRFRVVAVRAQYLPTVCFEALARVV